MSDIITCYKCCTPEHRDSGEPLKPTTRTLCKNKQDSNVNEIKIFIRIYLPSEINTPVSEAIGVVTLIFQDHFANKLMTMRIFGWQQFHLHLNDNSITSNRVNENFNK